MIKKSSIQLFMDSLADPEAYAHFTKDQEDAIIRDYIANKFRGKGVFRARVLSGGGEAEQSIPQFWPVRVRPLDIHESILPDPCSEKYKDDILGARRIIDLHPLAFGLKTMTAGHRPPAFGEVVNCQFLIAGPRELGNLQGIRYEYPTGPTNYSFQCANLELNSLVGVFADTGGLQLVGSTGVVQGGTSLTTQPPPGGYGKPNTTTSSSTKGGRQPVCPDNVADYNRLKKLADQVGIQLPVLLAIRKVESSGRNSAIRFEPHRFLGRYRKDLKGTGKIPYQRSKNSSVDYTKKNTDKNAFLHAFTVDPIAAVKSTSWGAYQVMGSNADRSPNPIIKNAIATPEGAKKFVEFFYANPIQASDEMLVAWFKAAGNYPRNMARQKNWLKFATRYNGSKCCGPGTRNYHLKLQKNYNIALRCPQVS